jgi:hypothetical protein
MVQATRISIFYTVLKLKPDYDVILKSLNTPGTHSGKIIMDLIESMKQSFKLMKISAFQHLRNDT